MTDFFERCFHAFVKFRFRCGIVLDFLIHRAHTRWYLRRLCRLPYRQKRDLPTTVGWTCVHCGPLSRAAVAAAACPADNDGTVANDSPVSTADNCKNDYNH